MEDFIQAIIDFFTDIFAAVTAFLGDKTTYDELFEIVGGLVEQK